ncbi:hypothetical protein Tco_0745313 [Tanacetum coccineum]
MNRTPSAHRTPSPATVVEDVIQKKKRKQIAKETSSPRKSLKEKLMEEDIEKMVDDKHEESYASEFADSLFLNEEDDSGTRLEPESHKENPKIVDDDDDVEEKKDDKKDDKNDDDDNDDHTDHTLVKDQVTGSSETRKEKMQTTIPSPHRSLRTDLSSNKTISQELTANLTVAKTNELIKEAVPRLDYVEQVIVMRENDKSDSFSEADFKYLNKNDIEEMYYLCLNKKVNFHENKLLNSLMTFIKSCIVMFCDVALERVLKEVKIKIFETEFWKKAPLLDEKVGVVREWKTNSTSDEAPVIINP